MIWWLLWVECISYSIHYLSHNEKEMDDVTATNFRLHTWENDHMHRIMSFQILILFTFPVRCPDAQMLSKWQHDQNVKCIPEQPIQSSPHSLITQGNFGFPDRASENIFWEHITSYFKHAWRLRHYQQTLMADMREKHLWRHFLFYGAVFVPAYAVRTQQTYIADVSWRHNRYGHNVYHRQ